MPQVAILGGGLGGPVLALFLKRHGITSEIFETRSKGHTQGGNIALAPNALRVLDHAGVYDRLQALGYNYDELTFMNGNGGYIGQFYNGSQKVYNFSALRILRSVVRDELLKEVDRQGIPIHYEKKCTGVESESESGATVRFEDGTVVNADFVVGADGIHSRIRPFIAPDSTPIFSGLLGVGGVVLVKDLKTPPSQYGIQLPGMFFAGSGAFAIMPSTHDGQQLGYFSAFEEEDRGREGWLKLENDSEEPKSKIAERFLSGKSSWHPLIKEICEKTQPGSMRTWPYFSVPHLTTWSSPKKRVIVIGDAAHAIPPTGGQGAAMAFEDAETLAYALSSYYKKTKSGEQVVLAQVISKWEQHRLPRVDKILEFTTQNGTMRKESPYYQQVVKEWLMWAFFKVRGPQGGGGWMYYYNAESVLSDLA